MKKREGGHPVGSPPSFVVFGMGWDKLLRFGDEFVPFLGFGDKRARF